MNCNTPGLPIHHQPLESTQTHVHWVSDTIQPSHPLLSPSPPALNPSQHQGLFKWVNSWHQVAKVSEFQLQHQSFQWTLRTDLLKDGLAGSPCSPRDSQESSPTLKCSKNYRFEPCISTFKIWLGECTFTMWMMKEHWSTQPHFWFCSLLMCQKSKLDKRVSNLHVFTEA